MRYIDFNLKCEVSAKAVDPNNLPAHIKAYPDNHDVFIFNEGQVWDFDNLDANGDPTYKNLLDPVDPNQEKIDAIVLAFQDMLDEEARQYGYDGIVTAVTYADEPAVPKFQTEGQALRARRSQVWAACYQALEDWQNELIPEPTFESIRATLGDLTITY